MSKKLAKEFSLISEAYEELYEALDWYVSVSVRNHRPDEGVDYRVADIAQDPLYDLRSRIDAVAAPLYDIENMFKKGGYKV